MKKHVLKSTLSVVIIFLFISCVAHNIYAQTKDELLRVYNNETIRTSGKSYVKGSKQLKFGDLKPEFSSGIAKDLYKKSKGNLTISRVFTVTSVAALITSAIIKKDHKTGGIVLNIAGIGLNLFSKHFGKQSSELIDEAIWHRNKEILFGTQ